MVTRAWHRWPSLAPAGSKAPRPFAQPLLFFGWQLASLGSPGAPASLFEPFQGQAHGGLDPERLPTRRFERGVTLEDQLLQPSLVTTVLLRASGRASHLLGPPF